MEFLNNQLIQTAIILIPLLTGVYQAAVWHVNNKKQIEINKLNEEVGVLKRENKVKNNLIKNLENKLSQQETIKLSDNKKLVVYNNTNKMRFFSYFHPESNKGSGYPINPKGQLVKELKGNSYKYRYYGYEGSKNSSYNEENVLEEGEFNQSIIGYKVIILDK